MYQRTHNILAFPEYTSTVLFFIVSRRFKSDLNNIMLRYY